MGAGLSNVWRFGDLDLDAPSGRLLLRGPNGTGKTTALEILWPYLLDLNPALLGAGKARNTHLSSLMKDGAEGRRRVGFMWLSFAGPGDSGVVSYGARLSFSEGSTPPVKVTPFTVPGRPLHDLALWGPGRSTMSAEQFAEAIATRGGTTFEDSDGYVRDLATRVFSTEPRQLVELARRIREVRNPALLGDVSPRAAADAMKVALPGVADDVIAATGEALAESAATRAAFEADRAAADTLDAFARTWTGHAVEVTATYHQRADEAVGAVRRHVRERTRIEKDYNAALHDADEERQARDELAASKEQTRSRLGVLERSDDYRAAGRLGELAAAVRSAEATAEARWELLERAAAEAARLAATDIRSAGYLIDDAAVLVDEAVAVMPALGGTVLFACDSQPRVPYRVGNRSADAGSLLTARFDAEMLDATVTSLGDHATELEGRADRARLYVSAHAVVVSHEETAAALRAEAGRLAATAEERAKDAKARTVTATAAAGEIGQAIAAWLADSGAEPGWDSDDLAAADWADPSATLFAADSLAASTATWSERLAAAAEAQADRLDADASALRVEAEGLRVEAQHIRDDDVLLPLPRPEWAGPGDDDVVLGAAIDWVEGVAAHVQDAVEAVLAAAGVLGATLTADGAATATWTVDAAGDVAERSLAELLQADADHPLADAAAAVLARISLVPTASADHSDGLVVGLDGTYRTGVLAAAVPDAQDPALRRPASHVGTRRRRDAALAHAAALDDRADALDREAEALETGAAGEREVALEVRAHAARFPSREALRDAESARVAAVGAARDADDAATEAERAADEAAATALAGRRSWVNDVTAAGLPSAFDELTAVLNNAKDGAIKLRAVAHDLDSKFRDRLAALAVTVAAHDTTIEMESLHAEATAALTAADAERAAYEELSDQVGATADEVLKRHAALKARLDELTPHVSAAESRVLDATAAAAGLEAHLDSARKQAAEAAPAAEQAVSELCTLLALPGVADAVLGAEPDSDDTRLLAQVGGALDGKARSVRRTLRERADETRARLAGVWSIDPGADHPELDTYLLTQGSTSFTPVAAAAHARILATKAEGALRLADEAALQDFVIGRLPAAIAQAWTRLFDWVREVNAKMRSASSSSGVGVTVRVSVRDDLPPVVRTVYELACKTGDALREPDAKAEAGRAIHQLINAADDDDMVARVGAAVDVRDWVDVTYQVTRSGETPRTWNSRTGLSGGERRLVVLAPMLAAAAAAYDRFPVGGGRLVALDEVPSEVDEEGRQGLARYIAELDLDLIATSHHWDGAPGAWDGIDAHDFEAAPDGTVVAFPMLIRGLDPLPDDHPGVHAVPPV